MAVAVELAQRLAQRLPQEKADGVAREPARHRGDGADPGDQPGPPPRHQHHRDEHDIGRNGKDRTLDEGHQPQQRQLAAVPGEPHSNRRAGAAWRRAIQRAGVQGNAEGRGDLAPASGGVFSDWRVASSGDTLASMRVQCPRRRWVAMLFSALIYLTAVAALGQEAPPAGKKSDVERQDNSELARRAEALADLLERRASDADERGDAIEGLAEGIDALLTQLNAAQTSNEALRSNIARLSDLLALEQRSNADLHLDVARLEASLQSSAEQRDALVLELRSQSDRAEAVQRTMEADRETIATQLAELERLRRDIAALREVRAGAEAEVARLALALEESGLRRHRAQGPRARAGGTAVERGGAHGAGANGDRRA